jgi:hypothetical protein
MSQTSKRFTLAQKAEIVGRHLSGKEPLSNLANEFGAQPSQIHRCHNCSCLNSTYWRLSTPNLEIFQCCLWTVPGLEDAV